MRLPVNIPAKAPRTSQPALWPADCDCCLCCSWLCPQEHCDLGSLHTVALEWQIAGEGDVQMWERLSLLLEVARGLKHLHSLDIVHGDLVSCGGGCCVWRCAALCMEVLRCLEGRECMCLATCTCVVN